MTVRTRRRIAASIARACIELLTSEAATTYITFTPKPTSSAVVEFSHDYQNKSETVGDVGQKAAHLL